MHDTTRLLHTMSEFTRTLVADHDVDTALGDLSARLVDVLRLAGAGVTLARSGRLRFGAASPAPLGQLEHVQCQRQAGPSVLALRTGQVVAVADLAEQTDQWPDYCPAAKELGLIAVAAIPMRREDRTVGVVTLYADHRTDWTNDLAAAEVLTAMATVYLINASTLHHQHQLNAKMRSALDSRLTIEQAKGVIACAHGIGVDDAFERIRRHARSHNVTVRAVADAIVDLGLRL